jgi:glycosyltransferase involved in cell wall biosynthesis
LTPELAILVPVLGRPHRVGPFLDAVEATTPGCPAVLFLADGGDDAEIEAIEDEEDAHPGIHVLLNLEGGGYAEKINRGVVVTQAPWIFTAADDLEPQPGWLEATHHRGAPVDLPIVFGLNDLIPRRRRRTEHATHFLMSRVYAELPAIDDSEGPMFTGYGHEKVDDELIATARHRGAYVYAPDSHVKHLHPDVGTADWDETYEKGRATRVADRELFYEREHLWT